MKFIESTIDEPFGFFEDYFRKHGIQKHYEEFKDQCIKSEIKNPATTKVFIWDGDCVIHQKAYNFSVDDAGAIVDVKNEFIVTDTFSDYVEKLLKSEVEKSKILLKTSAKNYLEKHNDITKLLNFQKFSLEKLKQDCSELFQRFPYCIDHLNSLNEYIQDLSNNCSTIVTEFNQKSENTVSDEEIEDIFDPIDEILGYLKGYNEHGQRIMYSDDYETLIELIRKVINNEEVVINKKLDIRVSVIVLKYTFYVLHLHLYGNEKNDVFIQFLLNAILTFKKWDFGPFKSKLSEPPSKFPPYIPLIIKQQREKQLIKANKN